MGVEPHVSQAGFLANALYLSSNLHCEEARLANIGIHVNCDKLCLYLFVFTHLFSIASPQGFIQCMKTHTPLPELGDNR